MNDEKDRNLTDADVDAVVDGLYEKFRGSLATNVGNGVLSLLWKGLLIVIVLLALYGVNGAHK